MLTWALAFPSWFGVVLLLWGAAGLCLSKPSYFLLPSLPALMLVTTGIVILNIIGGLPTYTLARTVREGGSLGAYGLDTCI